MYIGHSLTPPRSRLSHLHAFSRGLWIGRWTEHVPSDCVLVCLQVRWMASGNPSSPFHATVASFLPIFSCGNHRISPIYRRADASLLLVACPSLGNPDRSSCVFLWCFRRGVGTCACCPSQGQWCMARKDRSGTHRRLQSTKRGDVCDVADGVTCILFCS